MKSRVSLGSTIGLLFWGGLAAGLGSGPHIDARSQAATVTYPAGWNLVGGPSGTVFSQAVSVLYTFQSGDAAYRAAPNTSSTQAGWGHWAFFNNTSTVNLSGREVTLPFTEPIPAGEYIMIGKPSSTQPLTVAGADIIYTYSPSAGYNLTMTLQPGQGAWAFSFDGGTICFGGCAAQPSRPAPAPTPAPPGPSRDLRATAIDSLDLRLDWSPASGSVDGYEIDDALNGQKVAETNGTTTTDELSVNANTQYCLAVYAFNGAGRSDASNQACATTPP